MDIEKWFNEQKIEPVQDRKDGMDYWKNYELFTWNDVTECLQAMKELCEGKKADTGEKQCNLPVVSVSDWKGFIEWKDKQNKDYLGGKFMYDIKGYYKRLNEDELFDYWLERVHSR